MRRNEWLLIAVVILVLVAFIAATIYAGYITLWIADAPKPDRMATQVNDFVLSINLVLAANLGAYLGISSAIEEWDKVQPIGVLQWAAAWTYVVGFVMALVFWGLADFTEDKTKVAAVLLGIGRSGFAVIVAAVSAALGVKLPKVQQELAIQRMQAERQGRSEGRNASQRG